MDYEFLTKDEQRLTLVERQRSLERDHYQSLLERAAIDGDAGLTLGEKEARLTVSDRAIAEVEEKIKAIKQERARLDATGFEAMTKAQLAEFGATLDPPVVLDAAMMTKAQMIQTLTDAGATPPV